MNPSQFVDAKELAPIVEMAPRHVRRAATQRRLGIADCRDRACSRPVRWFRNQALERLRSRGYSV